MTRNTGLGQLLLFLRLRGCVLLWLWCRFCGCAVWFLLCHFAVLGLYICRKARSAAAVYAAVGHNIRRFVLLFVLLAADVVTPLPGSIPDAIWLLDE